MLVQDTVFKSVRTEGGLDVYEGKEDGRKQTWNETEPFSHLSELTYRIRAVMASCIPTWFNKSVLAWEAET